MQSNGITKILNILLTLCLLGSVLMSAQFVFLTRAYRLDSTKAAAIREWQAVLRAFATDCVAYSKQNPDILPLLDSMGWTGNKPAAAAPAPAKPATK